MRFLFLSDIHGNYAVVDNILSLVKEDFDWIVLCGDITDKGPVSFAEELINRLPKNTLAIHGNMDPPSVAKLLEEKGISIHCKKKEIGKYHIIGFGGSNPTPFGTPTEYSEEEIAKELGKLDIRNNTILVTHAPPFNVRADKVGSMSVGSKSIRKIIEEKEPLMHICGHIHENEGEETLGNTKIIKVGAAIRGRAVEVEVEKDISVKFIKW